MMAEFRGVPIDGNDNPAAYDESLNLIQVVRSLAYQVKQLTGKNDWFTPPDDSILSLNQSDQARQADIAQLQTELSSVQGEILPQHSGFTPGLYYVYSPLVAGNSTYSSLFTTNSFVYTPIFLPKKIIIDRLGFRVTAGGSNALLKTCLYSNTSNGQPGSLLSTLGEVDGSTAGFKEMVTNLNLDPDWYWLATGLQGTSPGVQAGTLNGNLHYIGASAPLSTQSNATIGYCYFQTGINYNSPPSVAQINTSSLRIFPPVYWFRVAP